MTRRLPLVALSLAVALLAAACMGGGSDEGSEGGGGAGTSADRAGETLTIYGFGPGDEIANTRTAMATKALAPAKVRNPRGAFSDQQFLARLASQDAPDIVYLDRQLVASYAAKGALQPLDSCIDDQDVDTSQYREAALDEVTYDGKVYALPEFTNQRALIVNDKAVQEAGLQVSDVQTQDWDKLREVTKRLAKTNGGKLTRIGFDPKVPEFFVLWAKANGVDLLSEDGLKANLDDPKAVEALEFTKQLVDAQGGWARFKAFRDTWDFFGEKNQVASNQVGAWPMESWYWNVLAETSPDAEVTAVPFTDREGNAITYFSGNGWAIPRGAPHPELACTWMKEMTSVDAWMAAAKARAAAAKKDGHAFTGLYTANKTADERILDEVYTPVSPQFDEAVKLLVDVQDDAFALPPSPGGAGFNTALADAITRVLTGDQEPQAALEQAQREAQAAIDDAA